MVEFRSRKDTKPARHSAQSFDEQQAIGSLSAWIAMTHEAMPDLKANDKWPNIDGYIHMADSKGYPRGFLRVQVKKIKPANIKSGTYTFRDKGKFLAFCRDTNDWIPTLFIGVEVTSGTAYWLHVDGDFVNNLEGSQSVSLIERQVISEKNHKFISEWNGLIDLYNSNNEEYEKYKNAYATLSDIITPALGISNQKFEAVHHFLDKLNSLLDNEFKLIKKIFYPGAWKIGLAYSDLGDTEVSYTLFPISLNKNDVMIKELSRTLAEKLWDQGLGVTMHSSENPIIARPDNYAYKKIKDKVDRALKYRRLSHSGNNFLAREYIFAFIDEFHAQMGLAEKDEYFIDEIKLGFYQFLPLWLEEAAKLMGEKNRNGFVERVKSGNARYYDPDWINELVFDGEKELVQAQARDRLERGEATPKLSVSHHQLPPTLFDEFLGSVGQTYNRLTRPYKKKDYTKGDGLVSGTLSITELKYNLDVFLENFPIVYQQIVESNFPLLREQLSYRDGADRIIFALEIDEDRIDREYGYVKYYLNGDRIDSNKIEFTNTETHPELAYNGGIRRTLKLDGIEYKVQSISQGGTHFIFEDTPMLDAVYKTLEKEMTKYFQSNS